MDIFCEIKEKLSKQIIDESDNFYLLHDGYPLLEGHLLLIPKKHIDCYMHLDKKLLHEFKSIKTKSINFLKEQYKPPVIFEHGIAGQTVLHAHLHLLPTNKLIIKELFTYASETKKPKTPYLYYEYNNFSKYFLPYKQIPPGLIHSYIYAQKLNRPTNGMDRSKSLLKWLFKVKKAYAIWKKMN